jgi:NDP-sugar pyrophosphorylase family protein
VTSRVAPSTALVLAAGLGTRLRPLTLDRAKPALPVAGPSLIERIVRWLAGHGVTDLIVNLHYRPETITARLGDGTGLGTRVRYSWEQPVLGSAGGPRRAFSLASDERLWLVNGDTLAEVPLGAMTEAHRSSDALVTMAVIPNPDPSRYGGVVIGDGGAVTGFSRRGGTGPSWHFVGVQIAERATFEGLPDGVPAESVGALYPSLIAERPGSVRAFTCEVTFRDIGTPADYLAACLALADGPEALRAVDAHVAVDARAEQSVLWEDVQVGSGARLSECVVMNGARVPEGFQARRAVIGADLSQTPLE